MARSLPHPRSGHSVFCRVGVCCPMVVTRRLAGGSFWCQHCLGLLPALELLVLKFSLDLDQHPVQGCVPGAGCSVMERGFVRCPEM